MRASSFSAGDFGCRVWILAFALSLILLVAFSKPWFHNQPPSVPSQNFQLPMSVIAPSKGQDYPPVLAYWICGTKGDGRRMLRLLKAIYHPRNQYLLQLDAESSDYERADLLSAVQSQAVFRDIGNVNVVGKSYAINQMGASALAALLHAAAMLLKLSTNWDWFINLSPSDYPLVSQDDLLHAISSLPRDLNFVQYANNTNWKENDNVNQIVVDPNLHLRKTSHLYYTVEKRTTPDAFNIFGGSPWLMLTRSFMEYCVKGWDNLPRKLLMYLSNTASPLEFYFHTVLCNSAEFQNTSISNNLRYNTADVQEFDQMVDGGAAFARPFKADDQLLSQLDKNVLKRMPNGVVPGKWCLDGGNKNGTESSKGEDEEDVCAGNWGNSDEVKAGSYGIKLGLWLSNLASEGRLHGSHCQIPNPNR